MKHNNCWEFLNCPKEVRDRCPAFLTYHGKDCFDFAENYCQRSDTGFKHCSQCAWYKKIRPDLDGKKKETEI